MEDILIRQIIEKINSFVADDCEGCKYTYASFKNHTCFTQPWCLSVYTYFKRAVVDLEIKQTDGLIEKVDDYGSSCN